MNKILLLMGVLLFSLPLQAQVEVCENDDATGCTTLEYDVDDLDDFNDVGKDLGDEISHIIIYPYTSVVLYKDKYFDIDYFEDDNIVYLISATSLGDTLDQEELSSIEQFPGQNLGLDDEISSIKVHPRLVTSCDNATSIDDCLMEVAKPILIYDEGTPDCNDRFRDGEAGFRSAVQTTEDNQYKIVFYEIYHKEDCGSPGLVGWAEYILDLIDAANTMEFLGGHEDDGETARFAFQKIEEGGETYWALVASRYQHHSCTTDKQLEEITWPLRIYISESKHAQFSSYWECDEWGLNDTSLCDDGTWTEIVDDDGGWDAAWIQEYENCDYWPEPNYQEATEVAEYLAWESETCTEDWQICGDYRGSDGGEILYPSEYSLVEGSFSDTTDWFGDTISLDEAGLVVLQPAEVVEEEVPVDVDPSWGFEPENVLTDGDSDSIFSYSDIDLTSYYLQSGSSMTAQSNDSITSSNFVIESGATATFKYGTGSGDSVVLSPFFWVERGAEFHVYSSPPPTM